MSGLGKSLSLSTSISKCDLVDPVISLTRERNCSAENVYQHSVLLTFDHLSKSWLILENLWSRVIFGNPRKNWVILDNLRKSSAQLWNLRRFSCDLRESWKSFLPSTSKIPKSTLCPSIFDSVTSFFTLFKENHEKG